MRRKSKSLVSQAKQAIQDTVRDIVIARDGGCIYRNERNLPSCNGYAADGHLILQADHLVSRGKNVGFAETRLIVCTCKGHHTAKTFDKSNVYEPIIRRLIGEKRAKLWDKARADRKDYRMGLHEWEKTLMALRQELTYQQQKVESDIKISYN